MSYPSSYQDDDGEYVYSSDDPEHTFFADGDCPYKICEYSNDDHVWCKAVLDRRLEKYASSIEDSLLSDTEFKKNILDRWNFWLFRHPDSMDGDTKPAKNQKLKNSAEKFLKGEGA